MQRVSVYIDGFNFYYSLKRARKNDPDFRKFYWLDFVKFFDHFMLPGQSLQKVYYFSAPDNDPDRRIRQEALLRANELINPNRFEVVNGKYYDKPITCRICNGKYSIPEEKRTDVNISAYMMLDCAQNNTDVIFLVTADSDLITPIVLIKQHYKNIVLKVFFPPNAFSRDISNLIRSYNQKITLLKKNKTRFYNSIMPDTVSKNGTSYTIPPKWQQPPPPTMSPPSPPSPQKLIPLLGRTGYINNKDFELSDYFIKHFGNSDLVTTDHPNWQAFIDDLKKDGKNLIFVSADE